MYLQYFNVLLLSCYQQNLTEPFAYSPILTNKIICFIQASLETQQGKKECVKLYFNIAYFIVGYFLQPRKRLVLNAFKKGVLLNLVLTQGEWGIALVLVKLQTRNFLVIGADKTHTFKCIFYYWKQGDKDAAFIY